MASDTLRADSAHVTPAPIAHTAAAQIADCEAHAHELESIIAEVGAAIYAAGEMLGALPQDHNDQVQHNHGTWLLTLAEHRLASIKGQGDDLSAKLSRLARQEAA